MKRKTTEKLWKSFKIFTILALLISIFSSSTPYPFTLAEGTGGDDGTDLVKSGEYGKIQNEDSKDLTRAKIDKKVSYGEKPGEYYIDLSIEGKDNTTIETADLVLVYDNSNSMSNNNRVGIAKDATEWFVKEILKEDSKFKVALVTYGTVVLDGRTNTVRGGKAAGNYSYKTLTNNPQDIINKLPGNVPNNRNQGDDGGTFTQQGLEEAGKILAGSNAKYKFIITITDGVPTVSYRKNSSQTQGDGSSFTNTSDGTANHGVNTITKATELMQNYELYTLAIEISDGSGATKAQAEELMKSISSTPTNEHAYFAQNVSQMQEYMEKIVCTISNSIVNGSVDDPIGDQFILDTTNWKEASNGQLEDGSYYLTATKDGVENRELLLNGVTVTTEGNKIKVNGLNLGKGEVVNLRYKVHLDTEKEGFVDGEFYPTNGPTTLIPKAGLEQSELDEYVFPQPQASGKEIKIEGTKIWEDFGLKELRPPKVLLRLIDKRTDTVVEEIEVTPDENGDWKYDLGNRTWYDKYGDFIDYEYEEVLPEGYQYYQLNQEGLDKVVNKLIQNPSIKVEKTASRTDKNGNDPLVKDETIQYTFEITNDGNIPLTDVKFSDPLFKDEEITFETFKGRTFILDRGILKEVKDGATETAILNPGDKLVATATHTITQDDVNYGQVPNTATVEGTPYAPVPNDDFNDDPVNDKSSKDVPLELKPEITLSKSVPAEQKTGFKINDVITYTLKVTNTGNTKLTNIQLTDEKLKGTTDLLGEDKKELLPGESFEIQVPYTVTQADVNAGEIKNTAKVEATPPPAYTEVEGNPNTLTKTASEDITTERKSEISLTKVASPKELIAGNEITYTFTAKNTGNTTLQNVKITDTSLPAPGIYDFEYVSIKKGEETTTTFDRDNITLEPGEELVATAKYKVTQDDVDNGELPNIANVTAKGPEKDEDVTASANETVTQEHRPAIEIVKEADKSVVTKAGEEVKYTFTVTNTGNVTLKNVKVIDPMIEGEITLDKTTLKPNESATGTATYTVTAQDIEKGLFTNTATATGTTPKDGEVTSEPKSVTVKVAKIELEKTSDPQLYTKIGDTITYTFTATNTGTATLNNVQITDEKIGNATIEYKSIQKQGGGTVDLTSGNNITLEPGDVLVAEATYTVQEADITAKKIDNTATVTGEPEGYDKDDDNSPQPVSATDTDTAKLAALELEKSSNKENITKAGETLTYKFKVTNTGSVDIKTININDPMLEGLNIDIEYDESKLPLKPGKSIEATAKYIVDQDDLDEGFITNEATVIGTPEGYNPEGHTDYPNKPESSSEDTIKANQQPKIEIKKVADKEIYDEVNERVKYTFTVTNTGNVTLTDVVLDDKTFGFNVGLIKHGEEEKGKQEKVTLAPGEYATAEYTHIVTVGNMDVGKIENTATAEGTPPESYLNNPDIPEENKKVTDTDIEITKAKQEADIKLVKTANKDNVVKAGDEITYTLSVTNTGNVTLSNVSVNDPKLGGNLEVTPNTLAPGETGTATGNYTVTQDDIDKKLLIENTATAEGTPPEVEDPDNPGSTIQPEPVKTEADKDVPITKDPAITLIKQSDTEKIESKGQEIKYTFTATNTGNQTLSNVKITDLKELENFKYDYILSKETGEKITTVDPDNITLKPGDILVATATYTVTQEDVNNNEITNKATAEGTPPSLPNPEDPENLIPQKPVTSEDEEKIPSEHKPSLKLEKSSDKVEVNKAGQEITYKFTVTNDGNVTLTDLKVNDDMLRTTVELEKTELNPGESTVGYAKYTVTQDDMDDLEKIPNIATVTGTSPDNKEIVSPEAKHDVEIEKNPKIEVVKAADKTTVDTAKEVITYTFTVTNKGNVTLNDVKVEDPKLNQAINLEKQTLAPGESTTGTLTYEVTQEEIDSGIVENVAKATGYPPGYDKDNPPTDPQDPRNPVVDEGEELVPVDQKPSISLEKSVDKEKVFKENGGDEVNYTFVITNTGNVTLKDIVLNDPMLKGNIELKDTTLAPGESTKVTVLYTSTQSDYDKGYFTNEATVTGNPPGYYVEGDTNLPKEPETAKDDATVVTKHPAIQLIKTSNTAEITEAGQVVKYTFKVKNAGNVKLENVKLTDETLGIKINLPKTTLDIGETVEGYAQYTVQSGDLDKLELVNKAKVEGTPVGYNPEDPNSPQKVTDEGKETIPTEKGKNQPSILLEKTGDKVNVKAGDDVEYTFKVTNTGRVTLTNVQVTDPTIGTIDLKDDELEPGESTTGTAKYTVTEDDLVNGEFINKAIATGTPEGSDPNSPDNPTSEDTYTVYTKEKLPMLNPSIKLVKASNTAIATEAGQEITYIFKVTNTGDVALKDVTVFDPMFGEIKLAKSKLNPGESTTGTATYTVKEADLSKPSLPNEAKAIGYLPTYDGKTIDLENINSLEELDNEIKDILKDNPNQVVDNNDDEVIETLGTAIQLTKTTDTQVITEEGQKVTFFFKVKNTGAGVLNDVTIEDKMLNDAGIEIKWNKGKTFNLAPGETATGTATYTVTAEDIENGKIVNNATATGTPEGYDPEEPNSPQPPTDEAEVTISTEQAAAIHLEKTSDKDVIKSVGEEVKYTFVVKNIGGTKLENITLTDPMLGGNIALDKTTLEPGESTTITKTYTVTAEDLEKYQLANTATVEGTPEGYNPEDPNSPQKVTDEDTDTVYPNTVPPSNPSIKLIKTSNKSTVTNVGEKITYTFKIMNTGDVPLEDITITDTKAKGTITYEKTKLAPKESTYATVVYPATQADIDHGEIYNEATVEGTPPGFDPEGKTGPKKPTDTDNNTVNVDQKPAIKVVKTSNKDTVKKAGETVTYQFEVTNIGNVTLKDIKVNDLLPGISEIVLEKTTLKSGETTTGTATYTVTQADIDKGSIHNEATATGKPSVTDPTKLPETVESEKSEHEVKVDQKPAIEIKKQADKTVFKELNERVKYTFIVKNTGNVTLHDVSVNDLTFGLNVGIENIGLELTKPESTGKATTVTLAPGEYAIGEYTHIVTQADMDKGFIDNEAETVGTPPALPNPEDPENPIEQQPVNDKDDVRVLGNQDPRLELVKEANLDNVVKAGDVITYTLSVTNTGNVTMTDVKVTDAKLNLTNATVSPSTLAAGETGKITGTYTVTQEDMDNELFIENKATAIGTPPPVVDPENPENETPQDPIDSVKAENKVPVSKDPGITLVKQADKSELVAGDTITFKFTATNTGNQTLSNVKISDPFEGLSKIEYQTINGKPITNPENIVLKPNDVLVAKATYKVIQEDVNGEKIVNKATAEGTPPALPNPEDPENPISQDPVKHEDIEQVPSVHAPSLKLVKTSDKVEVSEVGQIIQWKFVVTNDGNVTLTDVAIDDESLNKLGVTVKLPKTTLNPGESTVAYAQYEVTQSDLDNKGNIENIATAKGTDPDDEPVESPESKANVKIVKNPQIEIIVDAGKTTVEEAGEEIWYTFTVTNVGNVTLTDIVITDDKLKDFIGNDGKIELKDESGKPITLAPGESTVVKVKDLNNAKPYPVTQEEIDAGIVNNVADVIGYIPGHDDENSPNYNLRPAKDTGDEPVPVIQKPEIALEKLVDKSNVYTIGDTVNYTFKITNTGNVTLKDIVLNDPMLGENPIKLEKTELAPNESTEVTVPYTSTQSDYDKGYFTNEATVTGNPPGYYVEGDTNLPKEPETAIDDVKVVTKHPEIQLIKSTDTTKISEAGQVVTYKFKIKNAGNVTLTDITLNDPMLGGEITLPVTSLEPGETTEVSKAYEVKAADLDKLEVENLATVTGTPEGYDPKDPFSPQPPTDEGKVTVPTEKGKNAKNAAIQLEKTADKDVYKVAGDTITYTFVVKNIGNTKLENITLNDPMLGGNIKLEKTTLVPGETTTATKTYTVKDADLSKFSLVNTATVTGNDPDTPNNKVSDNDTNTVYANTVPPFKSGINLLKQSSKTTVTEVGEKVTYTFKVTNTGDVTLTNVKVIDPMIKGDIVLGKTKLEPGESTIATVEYVVTQKDVDNGEIINKASVEGTPPGYNPKNPSDPTSPQKPKDEDTNKIVVDQKPAIEVIKTSNKATVEKAGDQITYEFKVTNTGNVTLKDVKLTDEMLQNLGIDVKLEKTELQSGESTTAKAVYTVTQDDINNGTIKNVATATGLPPKYNPENPTTDPKDPGTPPVSPESENVVQVVQNPKLSLEKVADKEVVSKPGEIINYTFTVTNTGNVTLTDVTVNDPMLGGKLAVEPSTLNPGDSGTVKAEYIVTQEDFNKLTKYQIATGKKSKEGIPETVIRNKATVAGTLPGKDQNDPNNPKADSEADVKVDRFHKITVVKKADAKEELTVGDVIKYQFIAVNTGNITLNKVAIRDILEGKGLSDITYETVDDKPITDPKNITLHPGEELVASATYEVTDADVQNDKVKVENRAHAEGESVLMEDKYFGSAFGNNGGITSEISEAVVEDEVIAKLDFIKTSDVEEVHQAGDIVTYTFKLENKGNVTFENIVITDDMLGAPIELGDVKIPPGKSVEVSKDYVVTEEDMRKQELINVAFVTAEYYGNELNVPDKPYRFDDIAKNIIKVVPHEKEPATAKPVEKPKGKLPKTATNIFSMIGLGLGIALLGSTMLLARRRKQS